MKPRKITISMVRRIALWGVAISVALVVMVSWSMLVDKPVPASMSGFPGKSVGGWGEEALKAVHAGAHRWLPIPIANACGIGASSCFKCHNGQRAEAPKMDKENGLWHAQHMYVNDDCVGCHAGNTRLIKKDLAHTGMIVDPRTHPERCVACHKSGDVVALLKQYQKAK